MEEHDDVGVVVTTCLTEEATAKWGGQLAAGPAYGWHVI